MRREAGGGAKWNLNPPTVEDQTTKQTVNIQWMNGLILYSGDIFWLIGSCVCEKRV